VTERPGRRVEFTRNAQRDLRRLDPQSRQRVLAAIKGLGAEPPEGDVKRLAGVSPPEWRLRVGDWRVRFAIDAGQELVEIKRVLPRGRAYRDQ
jgi:mRNA interferase RelE/StbE